MKRGEGGKGIRMERRNPYQEPRTYHVFAHIHTYISTMHGEQLAQVVPRLQWSIETERLRFLAIEFGRMMILAEASRGYFPGG